MSPLTFHFFPKLPAEIQQMIWEAATRPSPQEGSGIHYFTGYHMIKASANSTWVMQLKLFNHSDRRPEPIQSRSIRYWDAGLRSACRQSCAVARKKWEELSESAECIRRSRCSVLAKSRTRDPKELQSPSNYTLGTSMPSYMMEALQCRSVVLTRWDVAVEFNAEHKDPALMELLIRLSNLSDPDRHIWLINRSSAFPRNIPRPQRTTATVPSTDTPSNYVPHIFKDLDFEYVSFDPTILEEEAVECSSLGDYFIRLKWEYEFYQRSLTLLDVPPTKAFVDIFGVIEPHRALM